MLGRLCPVMDADTIVSALLHDVVEDPVLTPSSLHAASTTSTIVAGVTDDRRTNLLVIQRALGLLRAQEWASSPGARRPAAIGGCCISTMVPETIAQAGAKAQGL